jgi:hypothetical protein
MLGLMPAWLRQLRVVVTDVKPPRFLVYVGINQLVGQVLIGDIFSHLDPSASDYLRIIQARMWLHSEELPEQYPVGFDTHECFTKVHKNRGEEYSIGVEIKVHNAVVPEHPLEEIAGR